MADEIQPCELQVLHFFRGNNWNESGPFLDSMITSSAPGKDLGIVVGSSMKTPPECKTNQPSNQMRRLSGGIESHNTSQ